MVMSNTCPTTGRKRLSFLSGFRIETSGNFAGRYATDDMPSHEKSNRESGKRKKHHAISAFSFLTLCHGSSETVEYISDFSVVISPVLAVESFAQDAIDMNEVDTARLWFSMLSC